MQSNLFHIVETSQAVIRMGGVYRQVKVYERNRELFAAYGSGYIKLMTRNRTSHPKITWENVDAVYLEPATVGGGLRYVEQPTVN